VDTALHLKAVLLDIEGTTTSLEFVTGTLFGFARERLHDFLRRRSPELKEDLRLLLAEWGADRAAGLLPPSWEGGSPEAYIRWLMGRDRKATGLKALQGHLWREGYEQGLLRGHVYDDVKPALKRWTAAGLTVAIFSSGSVQAQRLLFAHSVAGDLTAYLSAYFDTTTGPKREPESYRTICDELGVAPGALVFLSDTIEELDAAQEAGCRTRLVIRGSPRHPAVRSLADVV